MTYLFSGVLGLGEAIKSGLTVSNGDRQGLFAPFLHYQRKFDGSEYFVMEDHVGLYHSPIDLWSLEDGSNVYTMFGTLWLLPG